jgi:hypothetical protein
MRTLQRVGAGLFALTLFTGLAACGDDEDSDGSSETTDAGGSATDEAASGASEEFCGAVVEFNSTAMSSDVGNPEAAREDIVAGGEEMAPMTETLVEEAPDDLADDAEEVHAAVESLLEGDAGPFQSDALIETYMAFLDGATDSCEFTTVDVEGRDYAFEAPDTIEAGTTAFAFTNASDKEAHEMLIMRRADGVTESFEEIFSLPEEEAESKAEFVTATFAEPGGEGSALVDLEPGEYAMVCFVPVGGGEEGPPHLTEGMLHEFQVE